MSRSPSPSSSSESYYGYSEESEPESFPEKPLLEIGRYDDSVEPVPTKEEAAEYLEQLALEEEEEQTLLSRFSGEEDIRCQCCMDMDRCTERMAEVEKDGQCITTHPGYAACCLNTWVLSTRAISLRIMVQKTYSATKIEKNAAESDKENALFSLKEEEMLQGTETLTKVVGYTGEGANITLSSEEDTRLCTLANGDLSDDEDADVFVDTAAAPTEDEREVSLPRLPGLAYQDSKLLAFY
ncbi:uncharacterized protein [Acropora muricata]|uniref:uncharacterized protein n=1 Tax=Acropora muricata TaxID=159855 RepID=UPI0034E3EC96